MSNEQVAVEATTLATSTAVAAPVVDPAAVATPTTGVADEAAAKAAAQKAIDDAAQTPEAKAAAAKKVEDDAAAAKAAAVPEKYEFKAPEGVKADEATVAEFSALAKELKLPQAQAQRVYDIGTKLIAKHNEATVKGITDTQASWLAASRADKEFGGEKLTENLAIASKALQFATPEMKQILNESKLGDNPEMIRWMYRVGKAMSEDGHIAATRQGDGAKDSATLLYPSMTK